MPAQSSSNGITNKRSNNFGGLKVKLIFNLLAGNDGSIRENKYPEKYRKKIEFIKRWEEFLMKELEFIKIKE